MNLVEAFGGRIRRKNLVEEFGGRINQKKLCEIHSSNSVKGIGISPLRAERKSTSQHVKVHWKLLAQAHSE